MERIISLEKYKAPRNRILSRIRSEASQHVDEKLKSENVWSVANQILNPNQAKEDIMLKLGDEI